MKLKRIVGEFPQFKTNMNRILPVVFVVLTSLFNTLNAQTTPSKCPSGVVMDSLHKLHPEIRIKEQIVNTRIAELIGNNSFNFQSGPAGDSILTIPVVFHIIHEPSDTIGSSFNPSDGEVLVSLGLLNDAFRNIGFFDSLTGVDVKIEFCLASNDESGAPTTGITRTGLVGGNFLNYGDLLSVSAQEHWNTHEFMNIYISKYLCLFGSCWGGYGFFPSNHGLSQDGIYLTTNAFGNSNLASSALLAHEAGHYLGLYHTFQDGCINHNCLTQGDMVCDTPPDNTNTPIPCSDSINSCSTDTSDISTNNPFRPISMGGLGDQYDLNDNYMDYSDANCQKAFTPGQKERMRFMLLSERSSLLFSPRCGPPCTSIITDTITASINSDFLSIGDTIVLSGNANGPSQSGWFVNGVQVSSATDTSIVITSEGLFTYQFCAFNNTEESCKKCESFTVTTTCNNSGVDTQEACDSLIWMDGNTYYASNNFATYTLSNVLGCDSVVTLDLTINNSPPTMDVQISCDSIIWIDGNTYSSNTLHNDSTNFNLPWGPNTVNDSTELVVIDSNQFIQINIDNLITHVNGGSGGSLKFTYTDGTVDEFKFWGISGMRIWDPTINDFTPDFYFTGVHSAALTSIAGVTKQYYIECLSHYTYSNNWIFENLDSGLISIEISESSSSAGIEDVTISLLQSNNQPSYTYTNVAGCDSVIFLDLTIQDLSPNTVVTTACDSLTWDDGNTYTSNNNTALYTTTSSAGCDSVLLLDLTILNSTQSMESITSCDSYTWIDGITYTSSNNSANYMITNAVGCDSTISLDLVINQSSVSTDVVAACDSFTWMDGISYTTSNNSSTYLLTNSLGCDSLITLDLTINQATFSSDVISACDSFVWLDGVSYASSNNSATYLLVNSQGCDSLVTLDLTINYSSLGTDLITACDSLTWMDGNTYTSNNNTAVYNLTNSVGCDSMITLDLIVNHSSSGTDTQVACDSLTWIDGNTYTSNNNSATFSIPNALGCDSIITLDLSINSNSGIDVQTACDSFVWIDGNTYTANNNTAVQTLTNANGCDSLVTLNLTVLNSTSSIDTHVACDSYTWIDGNTYTANNTTATHVLSNSAGCDSLVTLDLTITTVDTSVTQTGIVLSANETAASYQWLDCFDMTPIVGANSQTYTSISNGEYAVIVTSNGCSDTSDCYIVSTIGIIESDFLNNLLVFPNPTTGEFSIDMGKVYPEIKITIADLNGKIIQSKTLYQKQLLNLEMNEPAGVYVLIIESEQKKAQIELIKK